MKNKCFWEGGLIFFILTIRIIIIIIYFFFVNWLSPPGPYSNLGNTYTSRLRVRFLAWLRSRNLLIQFLQNVKWGFADRKAIRKRLWFHTVNNLEWSNPLTFRKWRGKTAQFLIPVGNLIQIHCIMAISIPIFHCIIICLRRKRRRKNASHSKKTETKT